MLTTTIVGSLPKPAWLAEPKRLWAPWRLPAALLAEGRGEAALAALKEHEAAGEQASLGVEVVKLEERAFNVYLDDVATWGVEALNRAVADIPCRTAVHICYGYGIPANVEWKRTLGSEWRQYERTFPILAASRIDQVSLECANSRVPLSLLGLLRGKDVLAGAIDVASDLVGTPEQVAA